MRSLEHLEQKKKVQRNRNSVPPPDEEMEDELDQPRFVPLNRAKSAFDDDAGKTFGGINTAPSVFDAKAAIRTDEPFP